MVEEGKGALGCLLTVCNGVGEGHHDNGEECRNGIPSSAPGDAGHIHHHERPHHNQGWAHRVGGNASCTHTRMHIKSQGDVQSLGWSAFRMCLLEVLAM